MCSNLNVKTIIDIGLFKIYNTLVKMYGKGLNYKWHTFIPILLKFNVIRLVIVLTLDLEGKKISV